VAGTLKNIVLDLVGNLGQTSGTSGGTSCHVLDSESKQTEKTTPPRADRNTFTFIVVRVGRV
jgi:hypothetical protein